MTPFLVVDQASASYPVYVGRDLLAKVGALVGSLVKPRGRVFVITSDALRARFGEAVAASFSSPAAIITMAESVMYPYYAGAPRVWEALTPHTDQHLGGLIMWIPGGLVFLIAITVVFCRWQAAGGHDGAVAPLGASRGG